MISEIMRAQTPSPFSKEIDQLMASTAPGLNPAVPAAADLPNQEEDHCHAGQITLF
jgi:hypothetical protein